jgi:hypothetical protein
MLRQSFSILMLTLAWTTAAAEMQVRTNTHHAWPESLTLNNGRIEVVIVPEIGRIMQMRFSGEKDGPFWENRALDGRSPDSKSSEWGNFGGDKAWPAPQADWAKMTGRAWPPPAAFDSMPVQVRREDNAVVLVSPVDPHYGIVVERRIELAAGEAEMTVTTTFHKRSGDPVRVSVWIVTQLKDPEIMFMSLPRNSRFPEGYNKQSEKLPANLKVASGMVTCTRAREFSAKIGSDSSRLIWAGPREILEIFSEHEDQGEFPDNGSSAEIYTNPDPNAYIELELLGPLQTLAAGGKVSRKQTYRLHRRGPAPITEQVAALLR